MEEDGAEVFEHKDGPPSNLRTQILDEDLARFCHTLLIDNSSLAVLEGLLCGRVKETNAVVVAEACSFRNGDLDVIDGQGI